MKRLLFSAKSRQNRRMQAPGNETKAVSKGAALFIATLSAFLAPFMISAVNIAIPVIGSEFEASAVLLSWFATAYLLTATMLLVPFGRLADIHGRKRVFTYGMVIYTASALMSALSVNGVMLVVARAIEGAGAAMIMGTGVAILTSVFPPNERGRVLGINVAAVYLGLSLGPFIGGFITGQFGWRGVFIINIPLGLAALVLVFWKLKGEWAGARGESFDLYGSVIYSLSVVLVVYGLSRLPDAPAAVMLAVGALGAAVFIWWESRVEHPVLDVGLFRHNTVFAFSNLAALINYSATFAVSFLLSLFLQYAKGYSPELAGLVLVSQPAVMTLLSPLAGRLSDRVEPIFVATAGMILTTAGLAMFIFLSGDTSTAFIIPNLMVLGLGFALFSSPNTNAIMGSVEKRFYGVAAGTMGTMRTIGQILSMGIAMLVFSVYIGGTQIVPETYPSFLNGMRTAFIIFTILCFLGIFASASRGKVR